MGVLLAEPEPNIRLICPDPSDPDLVGAWLTDKTDGADDLGPNAIHGTAKNGAILGRSGEADFPGAVDNRLDLGTAVPELDFDGSQPFSVAAWVYIRSVPLADWPVIGKYNFFGGTGVGEGWLFFFVGDKLNITLARNTYIAESNVGVALLRWHHVMAVCDPGQLLRLYINGQETTYSRQDVVAAAVPSPTTRPAFIGRRPDTSRYADGFMRSVEVCGRALTINDAIYRYKRGVPDDSLRLRVVDGTRDLSRYDHALAASGGPTLGHHMSFDGTNDMIDCGDIGDIQTVAFWVRPQTTTEEILRTDAGADIMVNGGTITYTGLTPVATYVNGVATTALAADVWQFVVCVVETEDANNFELGTDGANYGEIDLRDVRAYSEAKSAGWVRTAYIRERIYY